MRPLPRIMAHSICKWIWRLIPPIERAFVCLWYCLSQSAQVLYSAEKLGLFCTISKSYSMSISISYSNSEVLMRATEALFLSEPKNPIDVDTQKKLAFLNPKDPGQWKAIVLARRENRKKPRINKA